MKPLSILALLLAAPAAARPAAAAQLAEEEAFATQRAVPRLSVREASHGTHVEDGVPTGVGHLYKASFEPGRFVFLPALGKAAPRDFPIAFTLEGVWRGDAPVHLAADVLPSLDEEGATYLRGGAIEERYDVTAPAVHQSFLFHEPLPGAGDLVVRGRLSTDLVGEPTADGGLLFRRDGAPAVRWGAVTGIDAGGRRVAGELRQTGTTLELVLPGAFVDGAAFPLLVDPVIGTVINVNDSTETDSSPEVATGAFDSLVVWERTFSLSHGEVYGQRIDSNGDLEGLVLPIATGASIIARQPSAGFVQASDSYLVALTYAPNFLSTPQIRCCSVRSFSGALSALTTVAASANVQGSPDVGGDWSGSDDEAFVVWSESGVGIRGRTVNVPENMVPVPFALAFTIDPVTATIAPAAPRISKRVLLGTSFLVVWQRVISGGTRNFVMGRMYDRNGGAESSAFALYANAFLDHFRPDCDGDDDTFLVSWEREEALGAAERDVVCRSYHWSGAAIAPNGPVTPVEEDASDQETWPSVALTSGSAVIAYLDRNGSSTDVYLRNVDPFTGSSVGELLLANTATNATGVSASPVFGDQVLVAWDDDDDVFGARYDAVGTNINAGGFCGNGGGARIPNALAGNSDFRIHLRDSTPGVLAACVTGLSQAPIGCGVCTLVPAVEVVYYDNTDAFGNASVNIPLLASYGGVTFYSQWVTFPPVGACPLAPIDFANAVRTTIASNP